MKCFSCDHADFENVAAPTWTRYCAAKGKIDKEVESVRKYQRLVDDGKKLPTSGDATQALEHGKIRLEKLDAARKNNLERIWAPFNIFWKYEPAQGSEFMGHHAAMYLPDKDKERHDAQGSSKPTESSPMGSSRRQPGDRLGV